MTDADYNDITRYKLEQLLESWEKRYQDRIEKKKTTPYNNGYTDAMDDLIVELDNFLLEN